MTSCCCGDPVCSPPLPNRLENQPRPAACDWAFGGGWSMRGLAVWGAEVLNWLSWPELSRGRRVWMFIPCVESSFVDDDVRLTVVVEW